jgi:hypothetical protein
MRFRDRRLGEIRSEAAKKLKEINEKQEREYQRLYQVAEEEEVLNAEIPFADILANHLTRSSPADCASLKGYGDNLDPESTRSEKSGVSSWNLLGIRGLEAVQVSSHRGPPTDRPPDKPPPWKGASRGCLQERAGTRHFSQLASSSRGSYCSSGNALPFAENAIYWVCAIEQFRVRAAGASQQSGTRASRAGGLRGVVGSGQVATLP